MDTQVVDTQDEEGIPQNIPGVTPDNNAFLESKSEVHHDLTPQKKINSHVK